jgi:hypothetical protein
MDLVSDMTRQGLHKLALLTLLAALCIGCDTKTPVTPVGPGVVTLSQSTSSTTTSTILPSTTAAFIFSPAEPAAAQIVSFNAFGSTAAPGRTIVSYSWDFGDGQKKTGVAVTHDFFPQGLYIVTLTVTDSAGETATVTKPIGAGVPLPSTTTTTISTNTAVRYVSTDTAPDIPADLSLFFQLLAAQTAPLSARTGRVGLTGLGDFTFEPLADSRYSVQGFYSQRNGGTGTISGELVGTLTPAPSGKFTGTLTATLNGCTATRPFSGTVSNSALQWGAMGPSTGGCQPDPLAFSSVNLVKSDAPPPLPPTTSTSTTTTTSVACNYSLNPVSVTLEAQAASTGTTAPPPFQTVTVGITTTAGCGWNMQTSTPWITLVSPTFGTGSATVSFQVANNNEFQRRVGSVVIAGITFLVTQNPPNVD